MLSALWLSVQLRRRGVTSRVKSGGKANPSDLTPRIVQSCNEGQSWRQIAESTGVSEGDVRARYLASIG